MSFILDKNRNMIKFCKKLNYKNKYKDIYINIKYLYNKTLITIT